MATRYWRAQGSSRKYWRAHTLTDSITYMFYDDAYVPVTLEISDSCQLLAGIFGPRSLTMYAIHLSSCI